ncbi:hypothetical protein [Rhizobium sp. YK2]|uniref:hypothetical protein n=1 Tax=Rhizobium sp. YK2 TaxID=1860096 RepID=UPI00114D2A64|nr:hypothetical protein [Rhizobium sp. YK2]
MRQAVKLLLFIATTLLVSQQARSEEGGFSGQWEQIGPNASIGEKCRMGIIRQGRFMRISTSNGWSATAETSSYGNASYAAGMGRWSSYVEKYSQKAFYILLAVRGDRLMVIMKTEKADGSNQMIRALFSRRTANSTHDKPNGSGLNRPPVLCASHSRRNVPV